MRYLTNNDGADRIDARAAIEVMRAGYDEYRRGLAEQIPRADLIWAERPATAITALVAVGTQGTQFAAVVGAILEAAEAADAGHRLPDDWLLQGIRS